MKRIIVTGGMGKAGRAVVQDLTDHNYEVRTLDLAEKRFSFPPSLVVDLTDYGQTIDAMAGFDAVVHLAAIPAPGIQSDVQTFTTNMTSTYNVFQAAATLGMERVVWASSETVLGLPFDREQPDQAPITEAQTPYPQSSYALSKLLSETMAEQFHRWTGIPFIGLRISNIMEPHDYEQFKSWQHDPMVRKWNLWGYVDARDVAQACRLGLEADISGAEVFIIAAADTCMESPNGELLQKVFPGVPVHGNIDAHKTLLSIDKAHDMLGYRPKYSWRDMGGF